MFCRLLIALLGSMLADSVLSSAMADDAANSLIDKAITAQGGADLLRKYPAAQCEVRGEMATPVGNIPFTGTLVYQIPERYRVTLSMELGGAQVTLVQTVLGDEVKTTLNGQPQPLTEEQKKEARDAILMQEISQLVTLRDPKRYTLTVAKSEEASATNDRVLVRTPGAEGVSLGFDPKTGLLQHTTRKALSPEGKPVTEKIILGDYHEVQGLQMPKSIEIRHDGKVFMTMQMTQIKLAEKLDPALFADPK